MEKFIATPVDQYGHWIVERWNDTEKRYKRHLPIDGKSYYLKDEAKMHAAHCNALADDK